ncbi:hypothetical protein Pan258_60470 [Symmachiella dynata]|uniref:Uncharacterized protein n=1 Tax=Symmachiella dynata TaxID=2527995 RepID=A0A517ZYW4_9PLAN|nr:hypothetical protein [Symmachiella dynata]QDT51950.1 hypothetical protein Pan258_60470 [Symmachiella dynata]QDU47648.1 hypothetical protein Mal52_61830 [Symmachiella dynata]
MANENRKLYYWVEGVSVFVFVALGSAVGQATRLVQVNVVDGEFIFPSHFPIYVGATIGAIIGLLLGYAIAWLIEQISSNSGDETRNLDNTLLTVSSSQHQCDS